MPLYHLNSNGSPVPFDSPGPGVPVVLQNLDSVHTIIWGKRSEIVGGNVNRGQIIAPGQFIALANIDDGLYAQTLTGEADFQVIPNATNTSTGIVPSPISTSTSKSLTTPGITGETPPPVTLIDWTDRTEQSFNVAISLGSQAAPGSPTLNSSFVLFGIDDADDPSIDPSGPPGNIMVNKYQWYCPVGFPLDLGAGIPVGPLTSKIKGPLPPRYRLRAQIVDNVDIAGPTATIDLQFNFLEVANAESKIFAHWADNYPAIGEYATWAFGVFQQRFPGLENMGFFDILCFAPSGGGGAPNTPYYVGMLTGKQSWSLTPGAGSGTPGHNAIAIVPAHVGAHTALQINSYAHDLGLPVTGEVTPTTNVEFEAPSDVMIAIALGDPTAITYQPEVQGTVTGIGS